MHTAFATTAQLTVRTFNSVAIGQREGDGYINATAMCKAAGRKLSHYLENQSTDEFIAAISSDAGIPASELVHIRKGGKPEFQGTWVHPDIAINLAQWCSPTFAVQVSKWVRELLTKGVVKVATDNNPAPRAVSPYQHRVIEGYQFSAALPDGYWCVFGESFPLLTVAEQVCHLAGLTMDYDDLLDGSIGRMWAKHRKGKEWATADVRVFEYRFPPPSKRANLTIHPNCYPRSELGRFRPWLMTEYAAGHFLNYLDRKFGCDGYRKALPHIRSVMPRALN